MNYAIFSTKTGGSGPNFDITALSFLQAQFCSMSLNDTAILNNCAEPYGRTKSVDARHTARLRVRCLPSANTFGPHRWTMVRAQIWSLEPKPAATCWSHLLRASTAAIILHFLKDKADSLATHIFFWRGKHRKRFCFLCRSSSIFTDDHRYRPYIQYTCTVITTTALKTAAK